MTIALEHIQPEDWAAVNRVVDVLRSLVLDTGGVSLSIRVGAVSAAGAVLAGTGFTAARTGVGLYTVAQTWARAPLVFPIAGVTAGAIVAHLTAMPTTAGFSVNTFTTTTGANADSIFFFVAIG